MRSYNRLRIPERPSFVLRLVSYGHANGPLNVETLNEKARLSFSVRDVPSPPAQQKKKYTGLSPRMRKEVFANKAAQGRLDQITEAIEEKMTELEEERSREPTPEPEEILKGPEPPREVIVGVMCEEGRHRSVSFVEEISRSIKRKTWDIKVEHRDLGVVEMEEAEDDESEEEITSPLSADPRKKKSMDKYRKKMRSEAIQMVDGIDME